MTTMGGRANASAAKNRYLKTLRRIPVEVRRSMATRMFQMAEGDRCLCGWALRDELSRLGLPKPTVKLADGYLGGLGITAACATLFGGSQEEWLRLYWGVTNQRPPFSQDVRLPSNELPAIETAFTIAVAETV